MNRRWNPWAALRRRDHLTLRWAKLDGCREVIVDRPDGRTIYLDAGLSQCERRALLAHALVHDERLLFDPGLPQALVDHEESQVRRIVADRLVPPGELASEVERISGMGDGVGAADVMEMFGVPLDVAHQALHLMKVRQR